jgi:signal transduction protein with GAF and PtsI domain
METKLDRPVRLQEEQLVQSQENAACSLDANYVLTWEEVASLAAEPGKPAETLMNVVALIARRFGTQVCSAYLLEPDRANLVLAATLGLRHECVGKLRMAVNEGLAGLVAEQVRPVAVEQVKSHPRFKYFSESGEEAYQSFLGVPLIDRGVLQGVLVVQTTLPRIFPENEIRLLTEAAKAVAPVVRSFGLWLGTCGGVGITIPAVCSAISILCAGVNLITVLSRC